MNSEMLINKTVNNAFCNLTSIAKNKANILGGYFNLIIPEKEYKKLSKYNDEIINQLFWKLCDEIDLKSSKNSNYKSFCFYKTDDNLLKDCSETITTNILNKKSSNKPTFNFIFNKIKEKNNIEDNQIFDTIFDVLLNYYVM